MKEIIIKVKNADANSKNVIMNVINSFIVKGGGIIIGFLTMPAYMRYFENDTVLGLWFTLLSVLNWILNFDLGIGNGLRNKIVRTMVEKNDIDTKRYISSAYIFLFFAAIVISILTIVLVPLLNWNRLFNVSIENISSNTLKITIAIVLVSIILQFFLRLVTSILYALQKSFAPNLLILITNLILLIFLSLSNIMDKNNNIIILAVVYLLAVNIPLIVTTILVFVTVCKNVKPSIKYYNRAYGTDTLKIGGTFLILQIESLIINNTSVFLITFFLESFSVVEYNVYNKIFYLFVTLFSLITIPVWSAVTKSVEEKNILWIKKTARKLQGIAALFGIGQLLLFPIMQWLVNLWLGNESISIHTNTMYYFMFETVIVIWSGVNASICNGLNELKFQSILMTVGAVIMVPVAYILVGISHDYTAIVVAHSIALLPYCVGQTVWLERFFTKNIKTSG